MAEMMLEYAIRDLFQSLPDDVTLDALDVQRLDRMLRERLAGRDIHPVDCDGGVAVLSLEDDAAALYRLVTPTTVSRELVHLKAAAVIEEQDIHQERPSLRLELQGGRVLGFPYFSTLGLVTRTEIRQDLEKRAKL